MNGYRHGKGTLVDKDNYRLYIGQWYMGYRHGKGFEITLNRFLKYPLILL